MADVPLVTIVNGLPTAGSGTVMTISNIVGTGPKSLTDINTTLTNGTVHAVVDSSVGVAQGSTTSGQTLAPVGYAVLTSAPTYITAQTNIPTLTIGGAVRQDISSIAGTAIVNGGLAGSQSIGGTVATNVAITDNPVNIGGQAVSSENTAVTTARKVQFVADLVGKQIVLPYANPENFVMGTTAAITDTTSTSVIASAGGSLRNYITSILVTNSHATVGTFVKILDGATIIWEGWAAAAGGGFANTFPVPLKGTAATAVNAQAVTTGANFMVSCAGYKGV